MKPPVHQEQGPATTLPVGSPAAVRGYLGLLARRHRGGFATVVAAKPSAPTACPTYTASITL